MPDIDWKQPYFFEKRPLPEVFFYSKNSLIFENKDGYFQHILL